MTDELNLNRANAQKNRDTINEFFESLNDVDKEKALYKSFDTSLYDKDKDQVHHIIPWQSADEYSDFLH